MGTVGDALDNAVAESFFATLQTELLDRRRWSSRRQLAQAIFEWIEVFYNAQRRHSTLGMLAPLTYATATQPVPAAVASATPSGANSRSTSVAANNKAREDNQGRLSNPAWPACTLTPALRISHSRTRQRPYARHRRAASTRPHTPA
jgi:hypothetical protein